VKIKKVLNKKSGFSRGVWDTVFDKGYVMFGIMNKQVHKSELTIIVTTTKN